MCLQKAMEMLPVKCIMRNTKSRSDMGNVLTSQRAGVFLHSYSKITIKKIGCRRRANFRADSENLGMCVWEIMPFHLQWCDES